MVLLKLHVHLYFLIHFSEQYFSVPQSKCYRFLAFKLSVNTKVSILDFSAASSLKASQRMLSPVSPILSFYSKHGGKLAFPVRVLQLEILVSAELTWPLLRLIICNNKGKVGGSVPWWPKISLEHTAFFPLVGAIPVTFWRETVLLPGSCRELNCTPLHAVRPSLQVWTDSP